MSRNITIAGQTISPGMRKTVDIPLSVLSNHTPITVPVHVVHGAKPGPRLFVSAAIHGDEIIGVEIVRRVMNSEPLDDLAGTLLLIPIVNAFGFINHSRYLPDRRDLNRSFPGSRSGSLAARLAHVFLKEIVAPSDFGIDLHSAAIHRSNLPQIRVDAEQKRALEMARAFGAPVILHSALRDGSLRGAAQEQGVPVLVYEAGEGLRFDEFGVRVGVKGIFNVMAHLGMVPETIDDQPTAKPPLARRSSWLRAPEGGILRAYKTVGDSVEDGEVLGAISDPFGDTDVEVLAEGSGLIVGRTNLPVVNQGDALFHVAELKKPENVENHIGDLEEQFSKDPLFDEDEIL